MAGGEWTVQNKVRPGAYINFKSKPKALGTLGERGIVTMPLILPWGPEKQIIKIDAENNLFDMLGIDILDPSAQLIKEVFKRAKTLLLYRVNTGTKATATNLNLTVTAKYTGTKGNDITMVVQSNIDDILKFDVITMLGGQEVDRQILVSNAEDLQNNEFVDFSGTGALAAIAGLPLTGGTDGEVTNVDYTDYLDAAELYEFNTMALPVKDDGLKSIAATFIKRLREQEGKKVQAVLENYAIADDEGIISVKNGVILSDGTKIPAEKATAWVAGATAGAQVNQSNTYTAYDGALDVDTRYTNSQIIAALQAGEFVFVTANDKVIVEQDINTFTSFVPEKGKAFSKNRVIRVLDSIANDIKSIFEKFYLGKVDNSDDGRNLFKSEIITYLSRLQEIAAVQNFEGDDVEVIAGNEIDAVVVNLKVQPVDSMEKLYMTVEVR